MKNLIAAIQFITIIPLGKHGKFNAEKMIPLFPVVGIVLGLMVALFDKIGLLLWSKPVASLLDVIFLILITGAFHVDGLGDTADGLYGGRTKEKALSIMKDSRIGVMGMVAIMGGLSAKWAGITGLDASRSLLLIIIPSYARGGILCGIRFLKYGRTDGGTGKLFFATRLKAIGFSALVIPVFLSIFLGLKAVLLNLAFMMITAGVLWFYKKKMDCVTGDMLGAMVEILEAGLFLLASIRLF
ncbi:MAG: adenosylcobinamide-GDP ribazoletransferase [Thermodesulfobacteriota bacterium]|nr:adenosylcobinamide-GDP ribazoletransferase [Thermodesulfobacteriota bacterium]